jgi:hypothetical protein
MARRYQGATKEVCTQVDISQIVLKPGQYVLIHAGETNIEVLLFPNGQHRICVTDDAVIRSFKEVYGE